MNIELKQLKDYVKNLKVTKKQARDILLSSGIITKSGKLSAKYR